MLIDWVHFAPLPALAGGLLIGSAAGIFAWADGRILGASGILSGLVPPRAGDWLWRLLFIAGTLVVPLVIHLSGQSRHSPPSASFVVLVIGGLLVGFGTRLGSGCTSGHGVCGLSRLSLRSLVAVITFMATGFITVFVVRHLFGGGA
jgi:uncharacterized membrane protein YedE/YeeE